MSNVNDHAWNSDSESSPTDEESIRPNHPVKTSAFASGYSMQRGAVSLPSEAARKKDCQDSAMRMPLQRPVVLLKDLVHKPNLPKLAEPVAPVEAETEEESVLSSCRLPEEIEASRRALDSCPKQNYAFDSPVQEVPSLGFGEPGYEASEKNCPGTGAPEEEKEAQAEGQNLIGRKGFPQSTSSLDFGASPSRKKDEDTDDEPVDGNNTPNFTMRKPLDPPPIEAFRALGADLTPPADLLSPNFSSNTSSNDVQPRQRFCSGQVNPGSPLQGLEALGSLNSRQRNPPKKERAFSNVDQSLSAFGTLSKLSPLKRALLLDKMGSPTGPPLDDSSPEEVHDSRKLKSELSLKGFPKDNKVLAILREERRNSSHSNSSQFSDRMSAFKQRLNNRSNSIFQHQIELEDVDAHRSNEGASVMSSVSITGDSALGLSNQELRLRTVKMQSMQLEARRSEMLAHSFDSKYVLGDKLGEGQHSSVYACHSVLDKEKLNQMAVKITREDDDEKKEAVRNEFRLMASLNHPNIARAIEKFENDLEGKIYTVMTFHEGIELIEQIQSKHKNQLNSIYTEEEIRHLMKQILDAVSYLHNEKQIVHRDLKPTNFIVSTDGKNTVHMIDFNVSRSFESRRLMTKTGTPHYNAPEIYTQKQYNEKVDVWSSGVILYMLITGELPFDDPSITGLINQIANKEPDFDLPLFSKYSQSCKTLLTSMLRKDPVQRPSAQECLAHEWFTFAPPDKTTDLIEPSKGSEEDPGEEAD